MCQGFIVSRILFFSCKVRQLISPQIEYFALPWLNHSCIAKGITSKHSRLMCRAANVYGFACFFPHRDIISIRCCFAVFFADQSWNQLSDCINFLKIHRECLVVSHQSAHRNALRRSFSSHCDGEKTWFSTWRMVWIEWRME